MVEGAPRNSFMHSLLAKGRLLYTHDATIEALCSRLQEIGERDSRLQLLLPREMEETYGLDVEVVHGRATYRNYRRFETGGRLVTPN